MGDRGTSGTRILVGGGIGAGKSTVLDALADVGFFVIEADRIGHDVLALDTDSGSAVAERWPSTVVDGALSRQRLAAIVFADAAELAALEAITHPAIRHGIDQVLEGLGIQRPAVVEVPVMGMMGDGWIRVAVIAPAETRVARAVARGDIEDDVRARMMHQPTDAEWIEWADHVVDNGGSLEQTRAAVEQLVSEVLP